MCTFYNNDYVFIETDSKKKTTGLKDIQIIQEFVFFTIIWLNKVNPSLEYT